ncbi:hypothetical protein BC830DRAFT_1137748 [Chytriomyces sp. MP71]|nr:hypothetical protein BC830DRAFT_1137748 [Chytriomyces sp. MP71]
MRLLNLAPRTAFAAPLRPTASRPSAFISSLRLFSSDASNPGPTMAPTSPIPTTAKQTTTTKKTQNMLADLMKTIGISSRPTGTAGSGGDGKQAQRSLSSSFPENSYIPRGHIVHVKTSRNNTIATLTKHNGDTIVWASCGTLGLKKAHRGTSDAGYQAVLQLNEKAIKKGLDLLVDAEAGVELRLNGYGAAREMAFRAVRAMGWNIRRVTDVTPIRHAGCRPKRKRRL